MFGEYAPFIVPAYAITFGTLLVTTIMIFISYRARKSELRALEEKHEK